MALIGVIAAVTAGIEALLWLSDAGWIGTPLWRFRAIEHGAFWNGLLRGWTPSFPGQPITMFATYALLHSGPGHLLGNLAVLAWLGPELARRLGARGFALVWTASVLGGAVAFAAISRVPAPMVGASGALFGLLGATMVLRLRDGGTRMQAVWLTVGLIALNAVAFVVEKGVLAWETHLGGFLAGLVVTALLVAEPSEGGDGGGPTGPTGAD